VTAGQIELCISAAREALKQGKPETAASIAARILHQSPECLNALEIKALVEIEQGDHAAAEKSLRSAIALAPNRRWPYADLARLLVKLGRTAEAEAVAREALTADFANPDAHAILGSLLAQREMLVPAAGHFERAIALAGRHPDLLLGLGRVLLRQGKLDAARPLLETVVAEIPAALEPMVYLAELEERAGRFDAALRLLDRAEPIAVAKGTDLKLQRSVLLDRMGKTAAALDLLEAEADLSGAALLQRGRLRDRLGRHDEAWSDWIAGKSTLAEQRGAQYPAADLEKQAEALASFFTHEQFAALPRAPRRDDLPQPIFILGFPRSGTTLTEQILASHSAIRAGGELPFGRELRELAITLVGGEAGFPVGLARMTTADGADWPARLRDFYFSRAEAFGLTIPGARYFTDKMPLNDMWLPLLRIAFPQSPVVLVRRHPLDALTSVMAHDMTHGFHCAYKLKDAARHLSLVDRLLTAFRDAGAAETHVLHYESLVSNQPHETRHLMTAIGLPMEPPQLRFHERAAVSPTPSYAQVREPVNGRSIGRWRNYAAQLEAVRPIIATAIANGGYLD
jgi:tetratricopeptide (TPR) repeat protein